MMANPYEISAATRSLIEATVREFLAEYDVEPCNVVVVNDDNEALGISVGICYRAAGKPISPKTTLALNTALRDRLVRGGDVRMPFVEHYFAVDQQIADVRRAC
jgi:hypothetical protein